MIVKCQKFYLYKPDENSHGLCPKLLCSHFLISFIILVAGDLPVVISCASLALADAGIMMYDLVAAVSVVSVFARTLEH